MKKETKIIRVIYVCILLIFQIISVIALIKTNCETYSILISIYMVWIFIIGSLE